MNGAQCLNLAGSYQCRCAPGWSGVNCQIGKINSQKEYMKYVLIFNETFICIVKKFFYTNVWNGPVLVNYCSSVHPPVLV